MTTTRNTYEETVRRLEAEGRVVVAVDEDGVGTPEITATDLAGSWKC